MLTSCSLPLFVGCDQWRLPCSRSSFQMIRWSKGALFFFVICYEMRNCVSSPRCSLALCDIVSSLLFRMVWPFFLPCQFPLSLIFCVGFRKGPKVKCGLASAIPPALACSDTPPHHFLSHAKSQKCRESAPLTFILVFLIFIIFTPLFLYFFQKNKTK